MKHVVEPILKCYELLLLQGHAPGQVRYGETKLLKVLGLRDDLSQLGCKVHHKLTVLRKS